MQNAVKSVLSGVLIVSLVVIAACDGDSDDGGTGSFDAGPQGSFDAGPSTDASVTDGSAPPSDAGADTGVDAGPPQLAFFTDFESGIPAAVSAGTGLVTPTEGFGPLGPQGNTFGASFLRSATANVVKVTFADLAPHSTVSIGFLFAAIDSLDGTGTFPAGDFLKITVDGKAVFRESFANATDDQIQSYVPPPGGELARKVDLGFQGPGGYYRDSAYDMSVEPKLKNIQHTASTLTIEMTIEGEGTQTLDDESWAIDNLRVTTAK